MTKTESAAVQNAKGLAAHEILSLLKQLIPNKEPVLLVGPPGVGKSDVGAQACAAVGAAIIVRHPVVDDPTDYKGMPYYADGKAGFAPFGDLQALIRAKEPTVCFIDDLGQAPPAVQAAAMQLILARRVNDHKISDEVTFIAATNRREDRAGVHGILEPLKSRFTTIVHLRPDVEAWAAWAQSHNVPSEVIAFVRYRRATFTDPGEATQDVVNRPSPRTVTAMGRLFEMGITNFHVLAGAVGEGCAGEFLGFIKVYQDLPTVADVLAKPKSTRVPNASNPAACFAIAAAVSQVATHKNVGACITYLERLPAEFMVYGCRDMGNHNPKLHTTSEFIDWAAKFSEVIAF